MEKKGFFARIHNDGFTWKDSIIIIMLQFILLVMLGSLLGFPFDLIFSFFSEEGSNALVVTIASYFYFIGFWLCYFLFCSVFKSQRPLLKVPSTAIKGNNIKMLLLGLLIGFGTNAICIGAAALRKDIFLYYDSFPVVPIILLFIAVFVQSSGEELLCRGFLYQRLRKTYKNPWVAILVNPFLFSAMHIANPGMTVLAALNIFVVGVLFGVMVYYFDSIWMAMAMHTAWNFTQNIIFGLPNSGIVSSYSIFKLDAATARSSAFYDVEFGVEATITALVVLSVSTLIVIYIGEKNHMKPTDIWNK